MLPSSHLESDIAQAIDPDLAMPQGAPCAFCSAPLDAQSNFCGSCGQEQTQRSTPADENLVEQRHFQCKGCGSKVAVDLSKRSYVCAFCDSPYVVEFAPEVTGRHDPEFIIGFAVTPDQARQKFQEWIHSNSWFRPGDLDESQLAGKLVGAYLPFWSFSMLAQSNWSASIGEYWYRTETYTTKDSKGNTVTRTRRVQETEWWNLGGKHHRYYGGYLVAGSKGLSQQETDSIKPFQLPALQRYEPYFLAGWICEEYSVAHDQALEISQSVFAEQERANVKRFLPGDTHRNLDVHTGFSHIHSDLCLLPIYVWCYKYHEKLYRFIVNGQTGKATGQKPVSGTRITVVVIAILLVIALIVLGVIAFRGF